MTLGLAYGGTELTIFNTITEGQSNLYVRGDENTDGSIRFAYTEPDDVAHIEQRGSGVWNDTGFRFSAESVELGRDLTVGAACSFMKTFNEAVADANQFGLVPAVAYKKSTGTTNANAPLVDVLTTTGIFTGAVSETLGKTIGFLFTSDYSRLIDKIFHEIGTVGAAKECTYSVYVGTDNTGVLVSRQKIPAGSMVANTTLTVDFDYVLALRDTIAFYIEIICEEPFTLKTDAAGKPLTTFSEGKFATVGMVLENMIFDNDNNHVLDDDLNPVYGNYF